MTDCQINDEISEEYFAENPDKIDAYLTEIFAAYAKDADSATLLSQLRVFRIAYACRIANIYWIGENDRIHVISNHLSAHALAGIELEKQCGQK